MRFQGRDRPVGRFREMLMKAIAIAGALAALVLSGCNKAAEGIGAPGAHGRYAGVGLYPADRMWAQVAGGEAAKDPAAARLSDDQQIIVVLDSQTGELRQCGNFSGYCVGMNPWGKPLGAPQTAPLRLGKHAAQLSQEDEAASAKASATLTVTPTH
jgi:hypothetical protein